MKHLLKRLLLALGLAAFCGAPFAVFDPVNDDTDLFRNNPHIPSQRPNVLLILDNSANWTTNFAAEKAALVTLVNGDGVVGSSNEFGLDSSFNVGLMIMGQGGGCKNSNLSGTPMPDGGYVRFGVRQMTPANKTALASIVNSFNDSSCSSALVGDQGSSPTGALAMHEAYLYYGGKPARNGITQVKRDYGGAIDDQGSGAYPGSRYYDNPARVLAGNPLSTYSSTTYNSAITADCQKNYIIYISNGKVSSGENTAATALFSGSGGLSPNAVAFGPLSPPGGEESWMDEYASYLATVGVDFTNASSVTAKQLIYTYVVDVAPGTAPADLQYAAMLQSMADRGKGKKYAVSGTNVAQELVAALKSIFSEINAVNTVFAASTLPVSVNVRGTNLNQLYIGVFRPDTGDQPRWLGNLKAYQLQLSSGIVRSVDANTQPAIDDATGFIRSTATSFWTQSNIPTSTYWSHLDAAAQGVGGASDLPDGNLVEKGGAAQRLRGLYYTNGVNGSPTRPIYTCTSGALYAGHECLANGLLSETPFNVANLDIDATSLNITSRTITSLSAASSKSITSIIDRRPSGLDNSDTNARQIASISVPTFTLSPAVSALNNSRTVTITAMANGAAQKTVTLTKVGPSSAPISQGVVTLGHGLNEPQLVIISDSNPGFNNTGTLITYVNATTFTYPFGGGATNDPTGTLTTSLAETTVTAAGHGFSTGDSVTIANTSGTTLTSTFAKTATITKIDNNSFKYTTAVSAGPIMSGGATVTGRSVNVVASATGHGLAVGRQITISGATPTDYNVTANITATTANSFTYQTPAVVTSNATGPFVVQYGGTTGTVQLTSVPTVAHTFANGTSITIIGVSPDGYNNTFTVGATVTDLANGTFTIGASGTPLPAGLTTATANPLMKASIGNITTVTVTLANHGYVTGDRIDIRNVADSSHNVTDVTVTRIDANTFRYTSPVITSIVGATGAGPLVRWTREIANNIRAYATVANHGYGNAGDTFTITISGASPSDYNRSSVTARVEDANTFSYALPHTAGNTPNTGGTVSTTGSALTNTTTAIAVSTSHGFSNNEQVTISGATVTAFTGLKTIQFINNDSFSYTVSPAQGVAVGSPTIVAAGQGERTALINWIRGENNKGDEGIAVNTRPRPSIHGDVLHSRPAVVNYNRTGPCAPTDTDCLANVDNDVYIFYGGNDGLFRAVKGGLSSLAGDPAVGSEIWAFAAPEQFGNLRRLRTNSPGISSGFKKPYFFDGPIGVYTRDANDDGKLLVAAGVTPDPTSTTQDKVWIYLTMRRGGRFIYAFDITQPLTPRLLWRKGCPGSGASLDANGCDLGWGELGQTWSEPKVVSINCVVDTTIAATLNCGDPAVNGSSDPVLMFGAGYDPLVEDPDPVTVNCATGGVSGVVRTGGTVGDCTTGTALSRSMGRGIFVVNARTGALIFRASGQATPGITPAGSRFTQVTGMDYAIPSDIAVVVGDPGTKPFRSYVGDTGGQMWRFDFKHVNPTNWSVVKLASIADRDTATTYTDPISALSVSALRGLRKFQFAPDVVGGTGFDMVLVGSGDREHPFDTTVLNRVYGFKDRAQTTTPPTLTAITHGASVTFNGSSEVKALLDVTSQCIEIPGNCTSVTTNHGGPEQVAGVSGAGTDPSASANNSKAISEAANMGWFVELGAGEKQVGSTLASGSGAVQFGTNQPSLTGGGGSSCSPNLGIARQYLINYLDGSAFTGTSLSTTFEGGGFLPPPVLVYVSLGGATGTGSTSGTGVEVGGGITSGSSGLTVGAGASTGGSAGGASAVVCYGAVCSLAPGSVLFSRLRKFWYKEID